MNIEIINTFVALGFFVLGCLYVWFVSWLVHMVDRHHAKKEEKKRLSDENQRKLDMIYKFAMHHVCIYEDKEEKDL